MRLIDADDRKLNYELSTYIRETGINEMPYEYATKAIDDAPTVDVLDNLRAEIAEYKDDQIIHAERNDMIDIVLEIIDKYKGEQP